MSLWTKIRDKVESLFTTEEAAFVAWVHPLLAQITPVIKEAAIDAVNAAVSLPGTGVEKAAAALATAVADLETKGEPIVINAIKGAIEIAYSNLPAA